MFYGGPLTWATKKQKSVSLSSAEAEYFGVSEASRVIVWLGNLLHEITGSQSFFPGILNCDSQGAIAMVKSESPHRKSKHIEIRCHFIRQLCAEEKVALIYVPTELQLADLMTKALSSDKVVKFRELIGLQMDNEERRSVRNTLIRPLSKTN